MQEKQITHQCDARLFALARTFAAKQGVRYYLQGVHIRRAGNGLYGGCVIEATNGHIAVVIHDPEGVSTEKGAIVSGVVANRLPKSGKVVIFEDGSLTAADLFSRNAPAVTYPSALLDADFPKVAKVFPDFTKLTAGIAGNGFNPEYLLKALKFFKDLKPLWGDVIFYRPEDDAKNLIVTNQAASAFVIVMSLAKEEPLSARPEWLGGGQ
jgi:hypothetical protein